MSSRQDHRVGVAVGLAAVAVLSPDSLIVRVVDVSAATVLLWRGGLVAVAMIAVAGLRRRRGGRPRRGTAADAAAGACWAAATVLFVFAVRRTEVASVLVIVGAGPVFAATIERLVVHEHVPLRTWAASVVIAGGLVWIFSGSVGRGDLIGDVAALGGSLSFAAFLTLLRRGRALDMTPSVAIGGALVAIVGLAAGGASASVSGRDALLLATLGLLILPASLLLTMRAAEHLRASEVSLLGRLETVLGPLWVWVALGDAPPGTVAAAGVLIVATTTLHSVAALRAEAADPSAELVDQNG